MSEKKAYIKTLAYYLPEKLLTNEELCASFPDWTPDKIYKKTGIKSRHVVSESETALDLAEKACLRLFEAAPYAKDEIDFIILTTQSPDYKLPSSACILQERLGIKKSAGAYDINLGCSAYIYGLMTAKALVVSGIAENVLLVTAETYSRYINPLDMSTRTLFGDGASATLISTEGCLEIGQADYGTDGSGYDKLIVPAGMSRIPYSAETALVKKDEDGYARSMNDLYMSGTDIFSFSLETVPKTVNALLGKYGLEKDAVSLYILHQANAYMLDVLRKKLRIPEDRFCVNLEETGNTVSSSIPVALKQADENNMLPPKGKIMLVGFGVGLSWGSIMLDIV